MKRAGAPTLQTLWGLARRVNEGVFPGRGKVVKRDVFDFLPEIQGDILYLDPPYPGTSSYEETYRILDLLLEDEAH